MRNIGSIFLRDLRKLSRSTAALVVLIGLLVTPAMYAWYNIGGSWDPYENTSRLRVAAVSEDAGYQGELINAQINLGDEFLTALHENEDLDWVFTDGEDAREGVKSGAYYAAVIDKISKEREVVSDALRALGFTVLPSRTNFVFASHKTVPASEIYFALKEEGVLVRHFKKARIDNFVRITIGTREDTKALLDKVAKVVKNRS